jgi:hypothetical protein
MKINERYLIRTHSGYRDFDAIQKTKEKGLSITTNKNVINCTKTHRMMINGKFKCAKDLKIGDLIGDQRISNITSSSLNEYFDPINVRGDDSYSALDINHHNCSIVIVDECVEYNEIITVKNDGTGKIEEIKIGDFYKKIKPNLKFSVLSDFGFKKFDGIKKSIRKDNIKFIFEDSDIITTPEHLLYIGKTKFRKAKNIKIGHKIDGQIVKNKKINVNCSNEFYDLVNVAGGNHYKTSGITSHNCAFVKQNLWENFSDSIFPAQSGLAWKKNILISTSNGLNFFYDIVKGAKEGINGYEIFEVDWRDVPRYKSDGSLLPPEEFQKNIIDQRGDIHWNQNYGCIAGNSIINIFDKETGEYFERTIKDFKEILR